MIWVFQCCFIIIIISLFSVIISYHRAMVTFLQIYSQYPFPRQNFANSRVVYWTLESLWPRLADIWLRESCVAVLTFPRLATSLSFHHSIGNSYDSARHIIKLQFVTICSTDKLMRPHNASSQCFDDMMARAGQHTAKSLTFCQFNRIRILNAFELFFTSSTIYGNSMSRRDGEGTMRWHHENSSGFDHEMPFHRALIIIIETRLLVVS